MLLGPKDWAPVNPAVQIKCVRASAPSLRAGVEVHTIDGVPVPITSRAKTVADCFKYRNKIGVDIAVEALRDLFARSRRARIDNLWRYAEVDRVQTVIRPYLEALA